MDINKALCKNCLRFSIPLLVSSLSLLLAMSAESITLSNIAPCLCTRKRTTFKLAPHSLGFDSCGSATFHIFSGFPRMMTMYAPLIRFS